MPQIGPILTLPLARPVAFDASRAGYGSAALLGIVVQLLKQKSSYGPARMRRQESAEMSAGISVRRSLLPKARMAGRSRSQAGMHWSLELALAVLYERCIHAL